MKHHRLLQPVAILGGVRIPFCRAGTAYAGISTLDLLTAALQGLVHRYHLKKKLLGEVVCGAVMKHTQDWNLCREAVLKSGLAPETPALDLQRACGTSLEAAIGVANKIACGQIEVGIAGGVDSVSDVPITTIAEPSTGKSMGEHCEMMSKEWHISRQEQDEFALGSHQKSVAAYENGFLKDLMIPFRGVTQDNIMRKDTSLEKLSKLKPVFDPTETGTLTAGNSTGLTDGAACVLLSSEKWAKNHHIPIQAYLRDAHTAAVDFSHEGLLMAPTYAVAQLLKRTGLKLQDMDFYEMHEAFAAQVLCTLKAWESDSFCREKLGLTSVLGSIDRSKLNIAGGSIALGHPFGATGARLVATLAKILQEKRATRGLLSVCTGGGMGVTAILER